MNTIKIKEDDSKFIEISTDDAEILTCKQMLNPLNSEFSVFIFENFEKRFFKNENLKTLFEIGCAYWKRYEKCPSETQMISFLNNERYTERKASLSKDYSSVMQFKEEDFDEKYVHDILIKFTKMRQIYFTMLDQFDDIEQKGEIGDCLARFEKIVQLDMISDLGTEYFSNIENHCNDLISIDAREPFGFRELDKLTYGGLPTKNEACMVVIMAQPGLGKSQFMMNIAYNWTMKGKNVLVISLEMSESMYSRRFDGLFADLNVNRLKENVGLLRLKISQIKQKLNNTQLRIKEFPTGTCSASMIKQYLKKLKRNGFVPDLICVDYLNIMRPNSTNANMGLYEKCARISEELRAISCEMKIPLCTAIQANRSGNGGGYAGADIDMSNVSESSGITATADALFALYQLEGEREQGVINLKVLKNRLGGFVGSTVKFSVNYETLKIKDMIEEGEVQSDEEGVFENAANANDNLLKNSSIIDNIPIKDDNNLEDL